MLLPGHARLRIGQFVCPGARLRTAGGACICYSAKRGELPANGGWNRRREEAKSILRRVLGPTCKLPRFTIGYAQYVAAFLKSSAEEILRRTEMVFADRKGERPTWRTMALARVRRDSSWRRVAYVCRSARPAEGY